MPNVAPYLYGQVLLWRVRMIFPVAPVGDFVATHGVPVSPRSRQEETKYAGGQNCRRWRRRPALSPVPAAAGLVWVPISRRRSAMARQRRRPFLPSAPVAAGLLGMATNRRRPDVVRWRRRPSLSPGPVAFGLLWMVTSRRRLGFAR